MQTQPSYLLDTIHLTPCADSQNKSVAEEAEKAGDLQPKPLRRLLNPASLSSRLASQMPRAY
jgi:hypothetical protein